MRSLVYLAALCLWLGFSLPVATADDVHQLAQAVDQRYNNLKTLEASFTETYEGAGARRSETGTLWLKKPGKMRWEYRQPRDKVFVTDGKTAWFYVAGERQARRTTVKNLDDLRSPLRYLLGKSRLEKEFDGLMIAPGSRAATAGNVVLRGIPKHMGDRLAQVLLEVSPDGSIHRLVAEEADGSITEFRFEQQKENVALPDERFHFVPPPGVETIEEKDLGQ